MTGEGESGDKSVKENSGPDLTSTAALKSLVSGQPGSVVLKVAGLCAPEATANGRRKFRSYLSNNENPPYVMRMTSWDKTGTDLSDTLKLFSVYRFKKLDVMPIYLVNKPTYQEKNITSSGQEFIYGINSEALLLESAEKGKEEEIMQMNDLPPIWKNLSAVCKWEKWLAGRVVTLRNFEKFTLKVYEYNKGVVKSGIYGVVGDHHFSKMMCFIECVPAEEESALQEFRMGYEFMYQEARSHLIGSTMWIVVDILYVTARPNLISNLDENMYQFVESASSSGAAARKSEVKDEAKDDAPPKRARKSLM